MATSDQGDASIFDVMRPVFLDELTQVPEFGFTVNFDQFEWIAEPATYSGLNLPPGYCLYVSGELKDHDEPVMTLFTNDLALEFWKQWMKNNPEDGLTGLIEWFVGPLPTSSVEGTTIEAFFNGLFLHDQIIGKVTDLIQAHIEGQGPVGNIFVLGPSMGDEDLAQLLAFLLAGADDESGPAVGPAPDDAK